MPKKPNRIIDNDKKELFRKLLKQKKNLFLLEYPYIRISDKRVCDIIGLNFYYISPKPKNVSVDRDTRINQLEKITNDTIFSSIVKK